MSARPRSGARRLRLAVAVLAVVSVGGWSLWALGGADDDPQVRWVAAARRGLAVEIEIDGTLRAVESATLGPPQVPGLWDYKISMMAPEGEEVETGAPVLAFDTSELEQQLQRQVAEADEAAKQIDKTRKNLEMRRRESELGLAEARGRLTRAQLKIDVPEVLVADRDLEVGRLDLALARDEVAYLEARLEGERRSSRAQIATLEAQRTRAENRVREIRQAIEQMVRRAPRPATVIYVSGRRDEKKKVGDSVWRGESVIELPDLQRMMGEGQVAEADAGRLEVGQHVRLRLDAHPDVEFTGEVQTIRRTVQRESRSNPRKVVRIDVALDETDPRRMRPGMRFRGSIELERDDRALMIPIDAVTRGANGPAVLVRRWWSEERVPVELGRRDGSSVEVLSGLDEGDRVAVPVAADRGSAGSET